MSFVLAQNERADQLLDNSAIAVLIAMVLDQQIPMERAFIAPYLLEQRLGEPLDALKIASMDPSKLEEIFAIKPALHRFPMSMAKRVADVCSIVAQDYGNDASRIWMDALDAKDLFRRISSLPGFGKDKTKIFIALLGKQKDLSVSSWETVCEPFGAQGTYMSVADIVDTESLLKVREFKAAMKLSKKA